MAEETQPQEYQVTARKWRPTEFDSIVGQEHVTQTVKNAIRSDRVHHAYLFCGPRGVGKTTTARILAKALNCTDLSPEFEPCNVCDSCKGIAEGRSMDVIEIDGASNNSVDDIRKLRDSAKYPPVGGKRKLYIIDEVHMLSTSAFNALLKTLEEPPRHLVFVFATTEPHKLPATILSRCQRFDFRRMQIPDIVGRLAYIAGQEGITIDEDALTVIARKADGSMRDAQSIFDQVTSFCGMTITYTQVNEALNIIDQEFFFRVTDIMRSHDPAGAFGIVLEVMRTGYDAQEFLTGLAEHLRNFLTVMTTGGAELVETARAHRERYAAECGEFRQGDMIRALHIVLAAQQAIRSSSQPRLRLELALVQLAVMDSTVSLAELLKRIDSLPDDSGGGAASPPGGGSAAIVPPPATSAPRDVAAMGNVPPVPPADRKTEPDGGSGSARNLASFPISRPPAFGSGTPSMQSDDEDVAVMEPPPAAKSVTLQEVQGRWGEFVATCNDRKTLAVLLGETSPVEMTGSTIRFRIKSSTTADILRQQIRAFELRLTTFFNRPMDAILEVLSDSPSDTPGQTTEPSPSAVASADDSVASHPFIRTIVEQLGASPI